MESTVAANGVYLDGRWVSTDGELRVTDLADGGEFETVGTASLAEVDRALASAADAEGAMADASVVQRAAWLTEIAERIEARGDELARTVVREAGKPITDARSEVSAAAERFRRAVEEVRGLDGDYVEGTTASHEDWQAIVKPEPVGTVVCVAPYNYPLSTTALHVAPALAAGNAVILKPASQTPVSGRILAEIIDNVGLADGRASSAGVGSSAGAGTANGARASDGAALPDGAGSSDGGVSSDDVGPSDGVGLPDGAFNYLPGRASEIGDALVGDERVDAIAMTGSSAAGKHVADVSGMVRLHMELGGNAPAVVFPDADLDATAEACANGSLSYAGQRCSAVSRVLAHESVHDALVARLDEAVAEWTTGDLFDEETDLGPLIDAQQADWVAELIADATAKGARVVRGGGRDGRVVEPTLLADVPHDARIVHEEQFGPVVPVVPVADERDALAVANDGRLGLDAAVFTADHDRAMRVADALEAGGVRINGPPSHGIGDVPFGGVNDSGIGREGIGYAIEAFVESKSVVL